MHELTIYQGDLAAWQIREDAAGLYYRYAQVLRLCREVAPGCDA
jgi:hypothetical protein